MSVKIEQTSPPYPTRHFLPDDRISLFIENTYKILQSPEYSHIVSWTNGGRDFTIHDVSEFTRTILPHYFKHQNYSSFVRQLNMYDFHKVRSSNPTSQTFKHPCFLKGQKYTIFRHTSSIQHLRRYREELLKIKRKTNASTGREPRDTQQMHEEQSVPTRPLSLQRRTSNTHNRMLPDLIGQQIDQLKKKQEDTQKIISILVQQTKEIMQDNKKIWNRMKNTLEKEDKKVAGVVEFLIMMILGKGSNNWNKNTLLSNQDLADAGQSQLSDKSDDEHNNILPSEYAPHGLAHTNHNQHMLIPFDNVNNSNKQISESALQALIDSLTKKKKTKHKREREQEIFRHNQAQQIKIINNLMNALKKNSNTNVIEAVQNRLPLPFQPMEHNNPVLSAQLQLIPQSPIIPAPELNKSISGLYSPVLFSNPHPGIFDESHPQDIMHDFVLSRQNSRSELDNYHTNGNNDSSFQQMKSGKHKNHLH